MRFLMLLTACLGAAIAQANQDADSNMSCVERLQMPVYPPFARVAYVMGTVTTTVTASADGLIHVGFSQGAHPLLIPAVEKALDGSTFRKTCAGKSVTLIFNFVIDKKQDPGGPPPPVSFSYPTQFWITVAPPGVMFN